MTGEPYSAGGIRTTVAATRAATDEQLMSHVARLVAEMRAQGTTSLEIKSGYGLSVHDEARSLAVARQFTEDTTFLGAHVVPSGTTPEDYVELVTGPMLAAAAPYARWIDVFCEDGAFDVDQARSDPGSGHRQRPARPSARQPADLRRRRPARRRARPGRGRPLHLPRRRRRQRARRLRHHRDAAARASSSRRGTPTPTPAGCSTPACGSRSPATATRARASPPRWRFCIALAVRDMGMSPAEAVHAATAMGAAALDRDDVGVIAAGKRADLVAARRPVVRPPRLPPRRPAGRRGLAGRASRRACCLSSRGERVRPRPRRSGRSGSPGGSAGPPARMGPAVPTTPGRSACRASRAHATCGTHDPGRSVREAVAAVPRTAAIPGSWGRNRG